MKFLQITLQKRLAQNESDIAKTENTLIAFGHYDRIEVLPVTDWHDFRPVTRKNPNGAFCDDYTMRLIYPSQAGEEIKQKSNEGDYTFWELHYKFDSKKYSEATKETPFFACCLINLADGCISNLCRKNGEYSSYMNRVLKELYPALKTKGENLHTAIYFTLGYTDLVVLFRANSYSLIQSGIDALRAAGYSRLNSQNTIVSSSYTIYGLFGQNDNAMTERTFDVQEKITAFCDISLVLGCSEQDFFTAWTKWTDKEENFVFKSKAKIYSITGNSDWRLAFVNLMPSEFCKLFESDGFFSDFAKGGKSHIKNVSTKLLFPVLGDGSSHGAVKSEKPLPYTANGKDITIAINMQLGKFEKLYKALVKNQHVHRRTMFAVRNIHKTFEKLIDSSHGYEVRVIAGQFFYEFLKMLNGYIESKKEWSSQDVQDLESCIGDFRGKMSFLLFDFWRSDQPFFEGQTIAHPSIGSTAKLLFAYNRIFQNWGDLWDGMGPENPSKDFSFLITSGGCDETITWDPFACLAGFDKAKGDVGIVQIPEASLYDVKGTLLRLAHEFFHLRGERMRLQRASLYFQGLCDALIDELKNKVIYSSIASSYTAMHKEKLGKEKEAMYKRIYSDIQKLRLANVNILNAETYFKDTVFEILWNSCDWVGKFEAEAKKNENGDYYYGKQIYATCLKLFEKFLSEKESDNPINKIAEALSEFQIKVAENSRFVELIYGKKPEGPFTELIWIFDETQKPVLIQKNIELIKFFIKRLSEGDVLYSERFQFLYKECFADCLAVRALGYSSPFDYILQFLYENRGVDTFFEIKRKKGSKEIDISAFVSWRLSVVCDVCFGNNNLLMVDDERIFEEEFNKAFDAFSPILHLELDCAFENEDASEEGKNYIGKYRDDLYRALCRIREDYTETRELPYVQRLKDYLEACLENERNQSIIQKLMKETEIVSKSSYSKVGDEVVTYLMDNWIRIYSEEENSNVESN